jgi:hypothetical protein
MILKKKQQVSLANILYYAYVLPQKQPQKIKWLLNTISLKFKKKINIKCYSIIFPTKSKEMQEKQNSKFSMGQLP